MATVYKAYDTRLEREVAVKVIRMERLVPESADKALKRFEREAKALARLTHPNIIPIIDYGEWQGKPYLVMDYLPGGTLKERLKAGPIPWQEAATLLLPIAHALHYAHQKSIIHRDVKPSNILITESGQPMLTDFGIAKILNVEETADLTGTSLGVGTPEYMAPEQADSHRADHRVDIYALGVVFYEMVTGHKPYTADTPLAVLLKHARDPLPSPRKFKPDLPKEVERVLLKALAKAPENRYQTAGDFAKALGRLAELKPSGKPRFSLLGLGAVLGIALLIFLGWRLGFLKRPEEQPPATPIAAGESPRVVATGALPAQELVPSDTPLGLPSPTAPLPPTLVPTQPHPTEAPFTPIVEEFWTKEKDKFIQTSSNVYIDDNQVNCYIYRNDSDQFVYRSLQSPIEGDFRLTVTGQINSWTNNCVCKVGLGDDVNEGIAIGFGWFGGGCPDKGPTIFPTGAFAKTFEHHCSTEDDWPWFEARRPYRVALEVRGVQATLAIEGERNATFFGTVDYSGQYDTLWIGNRGDGDWPECSITIESVTIEPLQ